VRAITIYTVQPGDTVYSIARAANTTPELIISQNELTDPDLIMPGQTLVILYPELTYTVKPKDTLYSIAKANKVSVRSLWRNNPKLNGGTLIYPDDELVIRYSDEKNRAIYTNGYAYPYISSEVLSKTLPYLSTIIPFTYGFTWEGELIGADDAPIIRAAREHDTSPIMMLSTLTEDGGFSNELASLALNDLEMQKRLINNVLENMKAKGYSGLEVDFEYVLPEDREAYAAFIRNLTEKLHPEGYRVAVALAPKTSSAQRGLLYESHDYKLLGEAADSVLLMTYEWGYTYGPPMAVAPINKVRQVLDYAVTQIPRDKIYMGVPNYGYDWALPYVRGEAAKSLSNVEAVELARKMKTNIMFDETAMAPYFYYTDNTGRAHVVWFEDARSIEAKAKLAREYGLRGLSFWNIMKYFPQNWAVVNSMYGIKDYE